MTTRRAPRCVSNSDAILVSDLPGFWFGFSLNFESIPVAFLVRFLVDFGFGFDEVFDCVSQRFVFENPSTFGEKKLAEPFNFCHAL